MPSFKRLIHIPIWIVYVASIEEQPMQLKYFFWK